MTFEILTFDQMDAHVLYKILDLRNQVFIVEQNCVYLDTDFKDQFSLHLLFWDDHQNVIGYSRLIPPGTAYSSEASIGRVITAKNYRGTGLGKSLMKEAVSCVKNLFPGYPIRLEAQSYLINFYSGFGFEPEGEDYLLDGILHREMVLTP